MEELLVYIAVLEFPSQLLHRHSNPLTVSCRFLDRPSSAPSSLSLPSEWCSSSSCTALPLAVLLVFKSSNSFSSKSPASTSSAPRFDLNGSQGPWLFCNGTFMYPR